MVWGFVTSSNSNENNVENPLEKCVKVDDWVIWRYVLKRILQFSFENVENPLEKCVKVKNMVIWNYVLRRDVEVWDAPALRRLWFQ